MAGGNDDLRRELPRLGWALAFFLLAVVILAALTLVGLFH